MLRSSGVYDPGRAVQGRYGTRSGSGRDATFKLVYDPGRFVEGATERSDSEVEFMIRSLPLPVRTKFDLDFGR